MSNWKITSFYYLEAESEAEAWSLATLELPSDSQITKIKREQNIVGYTYVASSD
jgi:hypothetical protein